MLWVLGDLPVVAKLAGTLGHNAKKPCRFCSITGVYSSVRKHYYYPSRFIDETGTLRICYDPAELPTLTEELVKESYDQISNSSGRQLEEIRKNTGIKNKSLLFSISTVVPFKSFPIDIMHLLYNISRDMIRTFVEGEGQPCNISNAQVKYIDSFLSSFITGISSSLAPKPPLLERYKTWKAEDHKHFVLSCSLLLFENILPVQYLKGWELFVELYDLLCRWSLGNVEVERIGELSVQFFNFVEEHIFRYSAANLNVCKYTFHLLLHLKENVLDNGPLSLCSQFWVERYIGSLVSRLNARRTPALAISKASIFNESSKMIYGYQFQKNYDTASAILPGSGYRFVGRGERVILSSADRGGAVRRALKYYFARKYAGITSSVCGQLLECVSTVYCFSGFIKLVEGYTERFRPCADFHDFSVVDLRGRADIYAAEEMDDAQQNCDVYYGPIRNILQVQINVEQARLLPCTFTVNEFHDVVVMDWACSLQIGPNDQIRSHTARATAFTQTSIEDITVVRRKIAVVEHSIPTRISLTRNARVLRSRRVCSLIDFKSREDYILNEQRANKKGFNKVLRLS